MINSVFLLRDALIPFATDDTIGIYLGLTNFGEYGGIAYQVSFDRLHF
jgi:hypothetical protein